MGKEENFFESFYGALSGHLMPGIQYTDGTTEFTFPTQREINEQDTPFLRACLNLYKKIKLFGLPHAQGWINERNTILEIYQICEDEKNKYESWRLKEGRNVEDRD